MSERARRDRQPSRPPTSASGDGGEDDVADVLSYFLHFLPVDEAAVSLLDPRFPVATLGATSPRSEILTDLQNQHGRGPAWDAFHTRQSTHLDITDPRHWDRWPRFSSGVLGFTVRSVTALPLTIGPLAIGAVSLYSDTAVHLDTEQLTLAGDLGILLARAAHQAHVSPRRARRGPTPPRGPTPHRIR